jgi:hypothetical protein
MTWKRVSDIRTITLVEARQRKYTIDDIRELTTLFVMMLPYTQCESMVSHFNYTSHNILLQQ